MFNMRSINYCMHFYSMRKLYFAQKYLCPNVTKNFQYYSLIYLNNQLTTKRQEAKKIYFRITEHKIEYL